MAKPQSPILFLHWLENPMDVREAEPVAKAVRGTINVEYRDVPDRAAAMNAIRTWAQGNDAAQFLFVGAHGDEDGLGDTVPSGIEWPEFGEELKKIARPVALWLFACESSAVARAWSPIDEGSLPASWIVGFPDKVTPEELGPILQKLVDLTSMSNITFLDEEPDELRRAAGRVRLAMYYPARLRDGSWEYLDVDEFQNVLGCTFKEYLTKAGDPGPDSVMSSAVADLAARNA